MYPYWSQVALWGIASLNKHHFESSSASNKHCIVFQGCSTYWGQCSLVLLPCGTYSRVALFWINTLVSFCFCLKQGHLPFLDPNFSVHSIIYHINYITSYISYWMFFGRNLRIYSSMHYCHMITNWYLKLPLVTMEAIVTHGKITKTVNWTSHSTPQIMWIFKLVYLKQAHVKGYFSFYSFIENKVTMWFLLTLISRS